MVNHKVPMKPLQRFHPSRDGRAGTARARVFCVIAVCSRLENSHLGTNGRAQRKQKWKQGKTRDTLAAHARHAETHRH
jgi:hypothetical protein